MNIVRREKWRFVRYCITGFANTGISYAIYALLIFLTQLSAVSYALSYLTGMLSSFSLNATWTFKSKEINWHLFRNFLMINLILLCIGEISLHVILTFITHSKYLAQIVNIVPITGLGFLVNRFMVFPQSIENDTSI